MPKPKAPAAPKGAPGGNVQSFIQNYLAGLTKGPAVPAPPDFSSPAFSSAVDAGVNAQVQPQVDAIKQQQGHEKFLYDQETENAKGYSEGLAKILTGGNTNDAGMQYSKDNFGGSYLGAIASQQGGQLLAKITQDFNNNDWQFASRLADAMAQIPALRDKITSNLMSQANDTYNQQYKSGQDDYNNRIQLAGVLINQQKTAFNQQRSLNNDAFSQKAKLAGLRQSQTRIDQGQQRIDISRQTQQDLQTYRAATNEFKAEGIALRKAGQARAVQTAITKGQLPDAGLSRIYQHVVDSHGDPILDSNGKQIPVKTASKKGAGSSGLPPWATTPKSEPAGGNASGPSWDFTTTSPFARTTRGGRVNISPTADRPGATINPIVTNFVSSIAGIFGRPLTIGTGTNHNQYVVHTDRVSDHWDGHAADIPASGATLTRLGQDALIAAGSDPTWARQQKGGLFNLDVAGHRVQIIFNTMEGGNHYTHLHVGVR